MRAANIVQLGIKELRGLSRDPMMLALIIFAFTFSIYSASTAMPDLVRRSRLARA